MNIAIIPARGGSRRIPRKNIRPFFGRPIIAYSIEAAKASGLFEHVVVSTDDDEIANVSVNCGAGIHHRPVELCDDQVGTQEVMRVALQAVEAMREVEFEYACCIYPCAPLMGKGDLAGAYGELLTWDPFYVLVEGWFYWGKAISFGHVPIDITTALRFEVAKRWIDINTEEEWQRAEKMYAALHDAAGIDATFRSML